MMENRFGKSAVKLSGSDLSAVSGGAAVGGSVISSGSFASSSGTQLDINVQWTAFEDGGGKHLSVSVSTSSYSLNTGSLANGIDLQVNGVKYTGTAAAVDYNGSSKISLPLASFSVPVSGSSAYMIVTWHFNGQYSGKMINDIIATGMANI